MLISESPARCSVCHNMDRIIRNVNANANDSHVDYHMHFGIDDDDYRGNEPVSEVLTVAVTGIIRVRLRGLIND